MGDTDDRITPPSRRTSIAPEMQLFVRDIVLEAMEHSAQQRRVDIVNALKLHEATCPKLETVAGRVTAIENALTAAKGGWKVMVVVGTIAGALGTGLGTVIAIALELAKFCR